MDISFPAALGGLAPAAIDGCRPDVLDRRDDRVQGVEHIRVADGVFVSAADEAGCDALPAFLPILQPARRSRPAATQASASLPRRLCPESHAQADCHGDFPAEFRGMRQRRCKPVCFL
jgi:hypothetical protein